MFTLYQIQSGDSWASGVARPVLRYKPEMALFFVMYFAVINICVLNVIVAIMVEQLMKSTMLETEEEKAAWNVERDNHIMREMVKVFKIASKGQSSISREVWNAAMEDEDVMRRLAPLNINPAQLEMLFDVVDLDGSGEIEHGEFVMGLQQGLREVRGMDISAVQVDLWRMSTMFSTQLEAIMGAMRNLRADFDAETPNAEKFLKCASMPEKLCVQSPQFLRGSCEWA